MSNNKFALLVPCFNAASYIEGFLENINTLTTKFDEIIFYDDSSTDNTLEILRTHNCSIIEGKINKGPAYARNQLAKATICNWFHFHDIDDLLHPLYLEKTAKIAETNNFDVVLCNVDWLTEDKTHTIIKWHYSNEQIKKDAVFYTLNNPIGGINGLYKKAAFETIGGFDEDLQMWEDSDLHVRLAINYNKFYITEETLSYSIRYPQSQSTNQVISWQYRLKCLEKYALILSDNPQYIHSVGLLIENLSSIFIHQNNMIDAKKAIELSLFCGIDFPSSQHILWKTLKYFLPVFWITKIRILQLKIAFR